MIDPALFSVFSGITDHRINRRKYHELTDILTIAICSTICGGNGWKDMKLFGDCKKDWLKKFLTLKNGIPSVDTFRRVISSIDPEEFEDHFRVWVGLIATRCSEVIAIDGKAVRGSRNDSAGKSALHMVSAWACENQMVFGQVATFEKSNEITAIPKLLESIALEGCIVTIDAMGCQKKIADKIVECKADYILAVKGNQETLDKDLRFYMDDLIARDACAYDTQSNGGHGRIEKRTVWYTDEVEWFLEKNKWKGLAGFAVVESERTVKGITSVERRYFITSLGNTNARDIGGKIRQHWGVENKLHWCLDVTFNEDHCTIRNEFGAQNMSLLRKIALNLIKTDKTKESVRGKTMKACLDTSFLASLLGI